MGEIKSTLDLVLEKTKHFSFTSEERQQQQQHNEIKKRIKGLLQKYQDELLSGEQLKADYDKLKAEFKFSENDVLVAEVFDQCEIDQDNRILLDILQVVCDLDTASIKSLMDERRQALLDAAEKQQIQLKQNLAREHSISGSAVVPNLEAHTDWQLQQGKIRDEFKQRLGQEKIRLCMQH